MERRAHPRYRCPDLVAMVRDPAASLDYYFKVVDVSIGGLALVASDPGAFPFKVDSVLDIQVFTSRGILVCRGVVARIIPEGPDSLRGFGIRLYSFPTGDEPRWQALVEEFSKRSQP